MQKGNRPLVHPVYDKYDEEGEVASLPTECVFCNIVHYQREKFLYDDDRIIIINTRTQSSRIHLLAIPKRHIRSEGDLRPDDIDLLRHMRARVKDFLIGLGFEDNAKIGFHKENFISVPHLHMHVIAGPYKN